MGTVIGSVGEPVAVRALREPVVPRDRDSYRRLASADRTPRR
jgi:hypothetical protein